MMKKIKFNNKMNRELKTLASISKEDIEIFLTEDDIKDLFHKIIDNRPELFEDLKVQLVREVEEEIENRLYNANSDREF